MHPKNMPSKRPKTIRKPAASFSLGLTFSGPRTNKAVVLNPLINPKMHMFSSENQSD